MSNRRPSKCRSQKIGNVTVLKIIGRLTPDEHDDILFNNVKQLVEAGEKLFLLDVSSVNYINSTGIGSIIQSFRLAQSKGGDFKLLNPSQCVSHIIQVSKLDSIFQVFHDQDAAIASFTETNNHAEAPKKGRARKASETTEEE
jgi:anti-sigma B factor antagonist